MDVPLAHYDIRIRHGLMGYKRKSSTFSPKADVVGLSAFIYDGCDEGCELFGNLFWSKLKER